MTSGFKKEATSEERISLPARILANNLGILFSSSIIDIFPLFIGVKFRNYIISKFLGSLLPTLLIINFFHLFYENLEKKISTGFDLSVTYELLFAFLIFGIFIILSNLIKKKLKL